MVMYVNVRGAAIHFTESGAGTPTLFLHGIPDSGEVWRDLTRRLSGACRCVVPDLPGFGKSAVPENFDITLDSMAQFIDDFVTAMGIIEPANLVVHDIGGPYGLAWALRHRAKVKRVVIMNTVFQSEYRWHRYGRICRMPLLGELMQALTNQRGLARELRASSGDVKPAREHIEATYRAFTGRARKMVLRLYRGLDPQGFAWWDTELRSFARTVPSLVMWGDQDPYIPSAFAERFGARQVVHFPGAGHWPQVEIPEIVSKNLLEFFSI